ncbi:MAG: hypothetical protein ABSB42_09160 [Tepidisphaeraceae bacterium]|jgi:hypothetical protein
MRFIEDKITVLDSHRCGLPRFKEAVEAGWVSAEYIVTHIHVRPDENGNDLFVFEICNCRGENLAKVEFAQDESPENVQARTRGEFENRSAPSTR